MENKTPFNNGSQTWVLVLLAAVAAVLGVIRAVRVAGAGEAIFSDGGVWLAILAIAGLFGFFVWINSEYK